MAASENPLTFEVRGAIAQYSNRALKLVRLRPARSGRPKDMEAVVPNSDGGGRGYLVLPFAKVPEFTQLDVRDSALQYEIKAASALNVPDPFILRILRLKVDQKHGATDASKAAAAREIEIDKAERFRIRLGLIAQLTRDCGTRMGDRFMASASTERLLEFVQNKEIGSSGIDVDELTKRVIHLTGQATAVVPADVEKRLERLVDLAAPFGTPGVPAERKTDGFLIRQRHGLAGLAAGLKETRPEIRATVIGAIDKAEPRVIQTLDFIDVRLNAVDGLFADLTRALKDWDVTLSRLQQARRSVCWGLDGWDHMVEAWDESKIMARKFESPEPLERNIAWIEQNMPIMPRHEWDPNAAPTVADDGPVATAQPVKMMHGWRDGVMDEELARRMAKKS